MIVLHQCSLLLLAQDGFRDQDWVEKQRWIAEIPLFVDCRDGEVSNRETVLAEQDWRRLLAGDELDLCLTLLEANVDVPSLVSA